MEVKIVIEAKDYEKFMGGKPVSFSDAEYIQALSIYLQPDELLIEPSQSRFFTVRLKTPLRR
jgi:hypothetical protein